MTFQDRRDAGRQVAAAVGDTVDDDPVVIALPRGGVPIGEEVAQAIGAPLDVLIVRKIGCPWQPELGVGALGEGDVTFLDRRAVAHLGLTDDDLRPVIEREREELHRRVERYRGGAAMVDVRDRAVLLVDDGIATGGTVRAAIEVLRELGAATITVAVPVASPLAVDDLGAVADRVVAVETPRMLGAIGAAYDDFSPTSDAEVVEILQRRRSTDLPPSVAGGAEDRPTPGGERRMAGRAVPSDRIGRSEVTLDLGELQLPGLLEVPSEPLGTVVFAHGTGSSRLSPRNLEVASSLVAAGFATLLFDLLTEVEARDRANVFDVVLLGERLITATGWVREEPGLVGCPVGYFGASTGAAAALIAAANLQRQVAAVVSRGGRPDLAGEHLSRVTAPTLLLVGGADEPVIGLNELARDQLTCPTELEVVPGAGHLFEEPGALEHVAASAARWFRDHLGTSG